MCDTHGPRAPQKEILPIQRFAPAVPTSEDCLYLNVFAPEWECPAEQASLFLALDLLILQNYFRK